MRYSNSQNFKRKVVVITGSSGGIGKECARILGKRGAILILQSSHGLDHDFVNELEKENIRFREIKIDLLNPKAEEIIEKNINLVEREYRRINVLINLAGRRTEGFWSKKPFDYSAKELQELIKTDVLGTFLFSKFVAKVMKKKKKGVIINTASNVVFSGGENIGWVIAKSAIAGITKSFARFLGPYGIRVNAVAPGCIKTGWEKLLPRAEYKILEEEPLFKRFGLPSEIAKVIVDITSDDFNFMTGQTIVVDGGVIFR